MKSDVEKLNPKELAFVQYYTALGEKTCGNATQAALQAGYSEESAYNAGWKLLQRPVVRQEIQKLCKERFEKIGLNTDKVLLDLEHDKLLARAKGDISSAIRADELQGKFLSMFSDRTEFVAPDFQRELDETERLEAIAIADIRLKMKYGLRVPGLPAGGATCETPGVLAVKQDAPPIGQSADPGKNAGKETHVHPPRVSGAKVDNPPQNSV